MRIQQQLMRFQKFMAPAGEGGEGGGGGSANDTAAVAAKAAADKVIADKAIADKAAADAAAAAANKPTDAEAALLKDVMKQKTRAKELETQLAQVNAALKSFEGIDAVKVKALMAEQEEVERKRAVAAGEFDRLTKQMADQHKAEQATLQQQIADANGANKTLQQQIADMTVGNSFASSKFVMEDLTLTPSKARVIYGSHFEFKDGKVVGYDKPAGASDRTMLVSSSAEPLSFEQALSKIVDADPERDQLLRSKMKPGAGSGTVKVGKKADSDNSKQLTSIERIAEGLKKLAK